MEKNPTFSNKLGIKNTSEYLAEKEQKKKYEKKLKKLFGNRKPEALGNEAVSYHEIINQISHY